MWHDWGPAIITLVSVIFGCGALFNRVNTHEGRLDKHDIKFDHVDDVLSNHAMLHVQAQAWRDGYHAGSGGSGSQGPSPMGIKADGKPRM